MADDADLAQQHAERFEELRRKVKPKGGPIATGECLYCSAALKDGARWCDASCRDDWERLATR